MLLPSTFSIDGAKYNFFCEWVRQPPKMPLPQKWIWYLTFSFYYTQCYTFKLIGISQSWKVASLFLSFFAERRCCKQSPSKKVLRWAIFMKYILIFRLVWAGLVRLSQLQFMILQNL